MVVDKLDFFPKITMCFNQELGRFKVLHILLVMEEN